MSAPSLWLVPKDRVLKAAKSAIYNIIPDGREMSYISAAVESVVPSLLLSTDFSSIYLHPASSVFDTVEWRRCEQCVR